jgi:regulator of PEP synthase PpsR (kinase-PPPase family)
MRSPAFVDSANRPVIYQIFRANSQIFKHIVRRLCAGLTASEQRFQELRRAFHENMQGLALSYAGGVQKNSVSAVFEFQKIEQLRDFT